jgi:hypothetical protein
MVVQKCICFGRYEESETPALLKALRADQELYHEALRLFYEQNMFTLTPTNLTAFKRMPRKVRENIRKLCIM